MTIHPYQFTDWLIDQGRARGTASSYGADVAMFASWFEQTNGRPLAAGDFTPADVREYRGWLSTVIHAAPATINRRLASLRAYGAWLVATGQLVSNPAAAARGARQQRLAPKWLSKPDQFKLIREFERAGLAARTEPAMRLALRNQALVQVLINTGLRISEVIALRWDDVQLGERSGWLNVHGKGDKRRRVPLNLQARKALAEWHQLQAPSVLPGPFGISSRMAQVILRKVGRRAGVEVSPHALRHTFAHNLITAGVSIEKVAALLGHSSLETTRLYITPGEADLAAAVAALDD